MSFHQQPTYLCELENGFKHKQISVRVIRKWKFIVQENPPLFYVHLILLDEQNTTIQATITKSFSPLFDSSLTEGNTYNISNFSTLPNVGQEKATNHPSRIWFDFCTRVIPENFPQIPYFYFNLKTFKEIIQGEDCKIHYIDVIGEIVQYTIKFSEDGQQQTFLDLQNEEGERIKCLLGCGYTKDFIQVVNSFSKVGERPILLLQFVKRNIINDEDAVSVSSTNGSTRILVNPNIPLLGAFKLRRNAIATSQRLCSEIDVSMDPKYILSMAEIKGLSDINKENKDGVFITSVTIFDIDNCGQWYYEACKVCGNITKEGERGMWFCEKPGCIGMIKGMLSFLPRYNVKYFVGSGVEEFACVILSDSHIGALLDKTASQLLLKQQQMGNTNTYPIELNRFMGLEVVIKIKGSRKENIGKLIKTYKVLSISHEKKVLQTWKNMHQAAQKGKQVILIDSDDESSNVDTLNPLPSFQNVLAANKQTHSECDSLEAQDSQKKES